MRRLLLLSCLLSGGVMAQDKPLSAEALFDRVAPSIWQVEVADGAGKRIGIGSSVVIAPQTLITNCHVVEKARAITVRNEKQRFPARLEYADPARDLCQLDVPGLAAAPVSIANPQSLRVGARLYAVGSPRGLELTLSDGLLSSLRRDAQGQLEALQTTVPISPGSSGGGLFDVFGRLVGVTTWQLTNSQNLNFAVPANWIAEVPLRSVRAAGMAPIPGAASPAPGPQQAGGVNVFEYRLRDKLSGSVRTVVFRIDRRDGDRLVINGGTRVEEAGGRVVSDSALIGGEFDAAMPPGGWIHGGNVAQADWSRTYEAPGDGRPFRMEIKARALGEEVLRVSDRELKTVRVTYRGYTTRGGGSHTNPPGSYTATAWYAPDLGRVVRFEARTRGGLGHTAFVVDEVLELVDARAE